MSFDDVKIVKNPGTAYKYNVSDRTTSSASATIKAGEPVKPYSTNEFVVIIEDGDPEISTDQFIGVAKKESTETSTVDGTVEIVTIIPMSTVLRAKATTAANIDTASELLGLLNDWVTFDVSTGAFTIDENEGSDPNIHGLQIIGGDTTDKTLDVFVHPLVVASLVGQSMD